MSVANSITSRKQFEGDTYLKVSLGLVRGVWETDGDDDGDDVHDGDDDDIDDHHDNHDDDHDDEDHGE